VEVYPTNYLQRTSPTNLVLRNFSTKTQGGSTQPTTFNFWNSTGTTPTFPAANTFTITVDGNSSTHHAVLSDATRLNVFGRLETERYPPFVIDTKFNLILDNPVLDGSTVTVTTNAGNTAFANLSYPFSTTFSISNFNPAISVNQVGYSSASNWPKVANIYWNRGTNAQDDTYVGTGVLWDCDGQSNIYSAALTACPDNYWNAGISQKPYQKVKQFDFSSVTKPGLYRVYVTNMGCSVDFRIDQNVSLQIAQAAAKGCYAQRCGEAVGPPWISWSHVACHTGSCTFSNASNYHWVNTIPGWWPQGVTGNWGLAGATHVSNDFNRVYTEAWFQNEGSRACLGGHHDAGDFSIYLPSADEGGSMLIRAAEVFTGGKADNLGIPESGDGIPDLLQEGKKDVDQVYNGQDSDGGISFIFYPTGQKYENGDPGNYQTRNALFKNTLATYRAVHLLSLAASSPLMKQYYPVEATNYFVRAKLGYTWLTNMETIYGVTNAYQPGHFYSVDYGPADDRMAALTGMAMMDTANFNYYMNIATNWTPHLTQAGGCWKPWGWWQLYEGYGIAQQDIACSVLTGRVPQTNWNAYATYFAEITNDLQLACSTAIDRSTNCSFRTPFPSNTKSPQVFSYYFGPEMGIAIPLNYEVRKFYGQNISAVAVDSMVRTYDFECGQNPAQITRWSGLGLRSPLVNPDQWSRYTSGFGSHPGFIQGTLAQELGSAGDSGAAVTWPPTVAGGTDTAMPLYDRIGQDRYELGIEPTWPEWCYNLAGAVWNMGMAGYNAPSLTINYTGTAQVGQTLSLSASKPGIDLTQASYLWQISTNMISVLPTPKWTPTASGTQTLKLFISGRNGISYSATNDVTIAP
jgi:hypothetical protein